ncbi:ATP-binding protein [bacterium]|nr:ATP-binding protein [bacterium]
MPGKALFQKTFTIKKDDFANAGEASVQIKNILKDVGFDSSVIRRVAVASYEAEMNVVMYGGGGNVRLAVNPDNVMLVVEDKGPGIPDVDQAMQEGFSTATDEMREMGFGAGMGLPNIKRNSDDLKIITSPDSGTRLEICIRSSVSGTEEN